LVFVHLVEYRFGSELWTAVPVQTTPMTNGRFMFFDWRAREVLRGKRLEEHRNGNGSAWTRLHKVIGLVSVVDTSDIHKEDNETINYMMEYGINNVRGGLYSKAKLSKEAIRSIEQRIRHIANSCLRCDSKDHFVKECPKDSDDDDTDDYDDEDADASSGSTYLDGCLPCGRTNFHRISLTSHDSSPPSKGLKECNGSARCGRTSHSTDTRYASTAVHGDELHDSTEDRDIPVANPFTRANGSSRCGRTNHGSNQCYSSTDVNGGELLDHVEVQDVPVVSPFTKTGGCSRCGRMSHKFYQCYASTHTNGYELEDTDKVGDPRVGSPFSRICGCSRCGRTNHRSNQCYASTDVNGGELLDHVEVQDLPFDSPVTNTAGCSRCGRMSHKFYQCYASTHTNGNELEDTDKVGIHESETRSAEKGVVLDVVG
jgi:hypothetical protein